MSNFGLVNHSSGSFSDLEMRHRVYDAQRDHRRQLVTYVTLIGTVGILLFSLLLKLSGG
jgi:hypothetical protein